MQENLQGFLKDQTCFLGTMFLETLKYEAPAKN